MFYVIAGITGISLGIVITMNTLISQHVVPKENIGTASSMFTLGRTLGQTIATGIFGLVFNIAINTKMQESPHISINLINSYISSGKINSSTNISQYVLNNIVLSGMHSVFTVVLIAFIFGIALNLFDSSKNVIN